MTGATRDLWWRIESERDMVLKKEGGVLHFSSLEFDCRVLPLQLDKHCFGSSLVGSSLSVPYTGESGSIALRLIVR